MYTDVLIKQLWTLGSLWLKQLWVLWAPLLSVIKPSCAPQAGHW